MSPNPTRTHFVFFTAKPFFQGQMGIFTFSRFHGASFSRFSRFSRFHVFTFFLAECLHSPLPLVVYSVYVRVLSPSWQWLSITIHACMNVCCLSFSLHLKSANWATNTYPHIIHVCICVNSIYSLLL